MPESLERLLSEVDPVIVKNDDGSSPVLMICEHAGRLLPKSCGLLGISEAAMASHIAWDIGAASLSQILADRLDATLVMQAYSRLYFDCNRSLEAPDAIVKENDGITLPENLNLSAEQRSERCDLVYKPFSQSISEIIDSRTHIGKSTVIVTIHSFTPVYRNQIRDLELGIIHDDCPDLAGIILRMANKDKSYRTAMNQPYSAADRVTHTLITHGINRGLPNVMLEVRNDLIDNPKGLEIWADRLQTIIRDSAQEILSSGKYSKKSI